MKLSALGFAIGALAAAIASPVFAQTVVSYDIENAIPSGVGGWTNAYTGTITFPPPFTYENYTGNGSGTLNDGYVPNNVSNNELLDNNAVITVNLNGSYTLSTIYILSDLTDNTIPGDIASVDVTVGGNTASYGLTNYGPIGISGVGIDQYITLTGLQASTPTTSFTLSNIGGGGYVAIGELEVSGTLSAVPEPSTWVMMLVGFGGLGLSALRRAGRRASAAA
jgi:PEP-CTERM motif